MKISIEEARQSLKAFEKMKGSFPFRLGTTSYIYPGEILPNVELLGDFVDEIQLLLFEGNSFSNIPDRFTMDRLNRLAFEKNLSYSVHLPLDAYPGHEEEAIRKESITMIRRIYEVGTALNCKHFVLHYASRNPEGKPLTDIQRWREQLSRSTEELLEAGISPSSLCVENLAYPYSWVTDLIEKYGLARCIDIGHLRVNHFPVKAHIKKHLGETKIIHLHGLKNGVDHNGLSGKDRKSMFQLIEQMHHIGYKETLILEVFQLDHLLESLKTFQRYWHKWQSRKLYS
jgi:sugar phosphate isomerase/epimerase